MSTSNPGQVPADRLQLISGDEEVTAELVEDRLHGLRQTYALLLLLNSGRREELAGALTKDPRADLERLLVGHEEKLHLQSAGPGSWWVAVLAQVGKAPQTALSLLSLVCGEGRRMLLERVRAATDLKWEEVESKRIANEAARRKAMIDAFSGLEKIKNQEDRECVRQCLVSSIMSANPKLAASAVAGLLPEPKSKNP